MNGKRLAQLTAAIGGAVNQGLKLRMEEQLRAAALKRLEAQQKAEEERWLLSERAKAERHKDTLRANEKMNADRIQAQKETARRNRIAADKRARSLKGPDDFQRAKFFVKTNYSEPISELRRQQELLYDREYGKISDPVKYSEIENKIRLLRANMARFNQVYQREGLQRAVDMLNPVPMDGLAQNVDTGRYIDGGVSGFTSQPDVDLSVFGQLLGEQGNEPTNTDVLGQMLQRTNTIGGVPTITSTAPVITPTGVSQQQAAQSQQGGTDKKVIMVAPDGAEGYVDKSKVKDFLDAGYKLK